MLYPRAKGGLHEGMQLICIAMRTLLSIAISSQRCPFKPPTLPMAPTRVSKALGRNTEAGVHQNTYMAF